MMYRVLLVEDESHIRLGLKKLIEEIIGGFQVVCEFADGRQALEQGSRLRPDVLITDIRMKDMNGLELIEKIRADLPDIHIVIISGYSDFVFMKKALLNKVTDYLLKPIDRVELTKCLNKIKVELDQSSKQHSVENLSNTQQIEGDSQTIRRIKLLIAEQLENNVSLKSIAEQVHLSPKYLSELFKRETNENFVDYIIRCRMDRAKHLLRTTQLKVYEIASLVGYSNTKHFMTLFRQETNQTPSEYRNQN